jgi:uncharacterized protein (UPF0333 family)
MFKNILRLGYSTTLFKVKNVNRGQTALEYLITYGWAILAIVIIAALFWAFFKPSEWLGGESVTGFSVVTVAGQKLTASGTLTLVLQNSAAEDVTITNIAAGNASAAQTGATVKSGSHSGQLTVSGIGVTGGVGSSYNLNVTVTYSLVNTGITGKVSSGMMSGKLS